MRKEDWGEGSPSPQTPRRFLVRTVPQHVPSNAGGGLGAGPPSLVLPSFLPISLIRGIRAKLGRFALTVP